MKILVSLSESASLPPKLYHSSNSEFEVGKTYIANPSKRGTFGDFEKIIDHYKPKSAISRLGSFFATPKRYVAEDQAAGDHLYLVEPVGKYSVTRFGFVGLLLAYLGKETIGYGKRKGYIVGKIPSDKIEGVKRAVEGYFSGRKVSKADFKFFDDENDGETDNIEVLSKKIKILKKIY